jgi:hypothetical protein
MFTDRIGDYRGKVSLFDFHGLAGFIARCGFFDWNADYSPSIEITDLPTYALQVWRGRETKTVSQYGTDEPPDFWVLAALVDAVAEKMDWTSVTR